MSYTKETGNYGEDLATAWIANKGYLIIERNWRHKHWEVDIIASKENKLHFFEIKTRRSAIFGHPEESIGKRITRKSIQVCGLKEYWNWMLTTF